MKTLAVMPTYVRNEKDLELVRKSIVTLISTADLDLVVVDDRSPRHDLLTKLHRELRHNDVELIRNKVNSGFSRSVNVGLNVALGERRDALLVNADMEFFEEGWLEHMEDTDAWVVGAQLIYPDGLLQHAGVYYSVLMRQFDHIFKYAPAKLPEANVPRVCPVTGALQLIKYECLALLGVYDETFRLGWEDVDYCLRVFQHGKRCVYQPEARALHFESKFRGKGASKKHQEWQRESYLRLHEKHAGTDFAQFMPTMVYPDPMEY